MDVILIFVISIVAYSGILVKCINCLGYFIFAYFSF